MQGVKDGAAVLGGEFIAGLAETKIPGMTPGTTQAAAVATVATVVVGSLAQKFVGKRSGEMIIAGAVAKFGRRVVKAQFATNQTVQSALGEYGFPLVTSAGYGGYLPRADYAGAMPAEASAQRYPY